MNWIVLLFSSVIIFSNFNDKLSEVPIESDDGSGNELIYTTQELSEKETIYELIGTNENCRISYFEITCIRKGEKDVMMWPCRSNQLDERTRQHFAKAKKEDRYFIENVKSDGDCLAYQRSGATTFIIKIK